MADIKDLGSEALGALKEKLTDHADDRSGVTVPTSAPPPKEPTPDEAEQIAAQAKARIAQILERGILNEKLQSVFDRCVPKGWGGRFVRDSDDSIIRHRNLNFTFEYSEGAKEFLDPDGKIRVGDALLMTINPENRELLKAAKAEAVQRKLGEGKEEYMRRAQQAAARGELKARVVDESQQVIHRAN